MSCYLLSFIHRKTEGGHIIPATGFVKDYDSIGIDSMARLRTDTFPDFPPDIQVALLEGTELTDVISVDSNLISARGFLVNEKVKDLLNRFLLPSYQYYPAIVVGNGVQYPYYWLHIVYTTYPFVDIEPDELPTQERRLSRTEWVEEMKQKLQASDDRFLPMPSHLEDIFYKGDHDLQYFPQLRWLSDYIISKRLYLALMENKVSGLELTEHNVLEIP